MDVNELAKEHWNNYLLLNKSNYDSIIGSFVAGYNAAYEWNLDMSTAPKDGTYILLADEKGGVHKASWDLDGFFEKINNYDWCVADSKDRDEGFHCTVNPVAWMPLPKYTHKP